MQEAAEGAVVSRPLAVFLSAALALLPTLLTGCGLRGSGVEATETRELESFDAIRIDGGFILIAHVEPTATQRLEIRGDDNIVPEVVATVSDGELELTIDHWLVRPKIDMTVEVWVPSLKKISVSGAADMRVDGLHGERFDLAISGVSTSKLSGTIDHFEVVSSGANTLEASELHAKVVKINVSGAGESEVWASEQLDATVSGAGTVRYHGQPEVQQDISGSGSVEAASD
jgi:hypothetical protein